MESIKDMIDEGELEESDAQIACPNCDTLCNIYIHKYDENLSALSCKNCKYTDWINDAGTKDNPRRCPYCEEYVTDEDIDNKKSVQCSYFDAKENQCPQLAHKDCVEYCDKCGWFCDNHNSDNYECSVCGKSHINDHIVSLSKDCVDSWGLICEECLYGGEEEEKEENRELLCEGPQKEEFAVKRIDSSAYLCHFFKNESNNLNKLLSILKSKCIEARPTGYYATYNGCPDLTEVSKAVCFTEGRLQALIEHAKTFSLFGFGFSKAWLHKRHKAAPAIYIHGEIIKEIKDNIPKEIIPFVNKIEFGDYDYHHEREWRVPQDVEFTLKDLKVVFAPLDFHNTIRKETDYQGSLICLDQMKYL